MCAKIPLHTLCCVGFERLQCSPHLLSDHMAPITLWVRVSWVSPPILVCEAFERAPRWKQGPLAQHKRSSVPGAVPPCAQFAALCVCVCRRGVFVFQCGGKTRLAGWNKFSWFVLLFLLRPPHFLLLPVSCSRRWRGGLLTTGRRFLTRRSRGKAPKLGGTRGAWRWVGIIEMWVRVGQRQLSEVWSSQLCEFVGRGVKSSCVARCYFKNICCYWLPTWYSKHTDEVWLQLPFVCRLCFCWMWQVVAGGRVCDTCWS